MKHTSSVTSSSYIDPSSLSLPSPTSEASPSQSPTPSAPSTSAPRKRARVDATPEEKREARAHRNRIAAQNSRDRRKQQFTHLEEKVRSLQQENEELRAELRQERERRDGVEKDKENAELKERVKSLEQGWEAVLKALQMQGLPSSVFAAVPKSSEPTTSSTSEPANDSEPSQQPPTTTFPVFSTPAPILQPLSPMSMPAPIFSASMYQSHDDEPTRHLARVANAASPAASLQRGLFYSTVVAHTAEEIRHTAPPHTEDRIEDWFREVLASAEDDDNVVNTITAPSTASLSSASICAEQKTSTSGLTSFEFTPGSMGGQREDMDMEIDQLLEMLPSTGDEFQNLLSSVLDESKLKNNNEEWTRDLVHPSVAVV